MPRYDLDTKVAKSADETFRTINESGAYVGSIILAQEVISNVKGTFGIELSFEDATGARANYMTLWIEKQNGEKIFGFNQLQSLLTCLKIRQTIPVEQIVKKYDSQSKIQVDTQVTAHPDLMDKPIGLILQKEEYKKDDGSIGFKMNIKHFFNAQTKQLAKEILEQEQPTLYDKLKDSYKDILLKQEPKAQVDPTQYQNLNNTMEYHGIDIEDEEIPF